MRASCVDSCYRKEEKKRRKREKHKKGTTYYMVSGRVEEGGIGEECTQTELGRVCLRFSAESQAKKEHIKIHIKDGLFFVVFCWNERDLQRAVPFDLVYSAHYDEHADVTLRRGTMKHKLLIVCHQEKKKRRCRGVV